MDSSSPRQQALAAIAQLTHFQLKLVVKFIQLLQWLPGSQPKPEQTASETTDPLDRFIGATHPGHLAQNIDRDLYG